MLNTFWRNGCYCSFPPQINMMLANLYRKAGQERSAVTSYKEVLRQCPLALDAIIGVYDHQWLHPMSVTAWANGSLAPIYFFLGLYDQCVFAFSPPQAFSLYQSKELKWHPWPWMWSRASPTWTGSLFGSKHTPSYMQETIKEPSTPFGKQVMLMSWSQDY